MMLDSHVLQLAQSILTDAEKVTTYLRDNNLPEPSFDSKGSGRSPVPPTATDIETARQSIIEKSAEMRRLMLGPLEYVAGFEHVELLGLQAVARLKMPMKFSVGESITFSEMATRVGLSTDTTKRLLRHAISRQVFTETHDGLIVHNAVSKALAENPPLLDLLNFKCDLWQASSHAFDAILKFPDSEEVNETGFNLAKKSGISWFQMLESDPERLKWFHSVMSLQTRVPGYSLDFIVDGYPWNELGDDLVVDIGGSHAGVSRALAAVYPRLRFVNQDLQSVIESAPEFSDDEKSRIQMLPHDFFEPQPIQGADVYFFRWIFHDWSDKYSLIILQNLIPALKPGAKVIVADEVAAPPSQMSPALERKARDVDLTMLATCNAKSREIEDWRALFQKADPRFVMGEAVKPSGSALTIMEWIWRP